MALLGTKAKMFSDINLATSWVSQSGFHLYWQDQSRKAISLKEKVSLKKKKWKCKKSWIQLAEEISFLKQDKSGYTAVTPLTSVRNLNFKLTAHGCFGPVVVYRKGRRATTFRNFSCWNSNLTAWNLICPLHFCNGEKDLSFSPKSCPRQRLLLFIQVKLNLISSLQM